MITILRKNDVSTQGNEREVEYRGLSTDTKPVEIVSNGSIFVEIDTGKIYMYDAENEQWKEI